MWHIVAFYGMVQILGFPGNSTDERYRRKVPSTFPWYRRVGGTIQSRVGDPIQSGRFCRAPSLITIGEAIPPPGIGKVAENSPNPDRLS